MKLTSILFQVPLQFEVSSRFSDTDPITQKEPSTRSEILAALSIPPSGWLSNKNFKFRLSLCFKVMNFIGYNNFYSFSPFFIENNGERPSIILVYTLFLKIFCKTATFKKTAGNNSISSEIFKKGYQKGAVKKCSIISSQPHFYAFYHGWSGKLKLDTERVIFRHTVYTA